EDRAREDRAREDRSREDVAVVPPLPPVNPQPRVRSAFDDLQQLVPPPRPARLEPIRPRRWPWAVLVLALVAGVVWFYVLPAFAPDGVSRGLAITEADLRRPTAWKAAASGTVQADHGADKAVASDKEAPPPTETPAGAAVAPGAAAAPDTAHPVAGSS